MDALERLTAHLCSVPDTEKLDAYHAVLAQQVLDQHAHELAEEIRQEADELAGWPDEQWVARKYANLIDPEVAK